MKLKRMFQYIKETPSFWANLEGVPEDLKKIIRKEIEEDPDFFGGKDFPEALKREMSVDRYQYMGTMWNRNKKKERKMKEQKKPIKDAMRPFFFHTRKQIKEWKQEIEIHKQEKITLLDKIKEHNAEIEEYENNIMVGETILEKFKEL